ncbi:unnamed protein product [Rodentolepis nana]|uniref:Uncharacterized protein n=1 Tax=Rodentolepis nana TaxID=102285 RepID=A0A0R3TPY6_RODNA|nr:unnamed protein product [Rodentolepis nana]
MPLSLNLTPPHLTPPQSQPITTTAPSRESQRNSVSPHRLGYSLELVNLGCRTWTASDLSYSSAFNRSRDSASRKTKYSMHHTSLSISSCNPLHSSPVCCCMMKVRIANELTVLAMGGANGASCTTTQLIPPLNLTFLAVLAQSFRRTIGYNSAGLRPGYTAGQLSLGSSKTSSIPGPQCFSSPGLDTPHNGYAANGEINGSK